MIQVRLLPEKKLEDYRYTSIEISKLHPGDFFIYKNAVWVYSRFVESWSDRADYAIALSSNKEYSFAHDVKVNVPREIDLRIERV